MSYFLFQPIFTTGLTKAIIGTILYYCSQILNIRKITEARCTSFIMCLLMVPWVIESIPHWCLIELFLITASTPQVLLLSCLGVGRSSQVERSLMGRWVVGSILHGVDPLSYFLFQPVLHNWCNKGRGMCYPVCGMVHIKEPLMLIDKSSLCGGSGFPFSLSEWSLTICLTPYNRR